MIFIKSPRKHKKYRVVFERGGLTHVIDFGDNRYEHYKDQTGTGIWSHLNHLDKERRKRFRARFGNPQPYTAAWFSLKYLW